MKQPMVDTMQTGGYDNLYTPKGVVAPIIEKLWSSCLVWECCDPGSSWITKDIKSAGIDVISTDVEYDFLNNKDDIDFDVIVTNPPYSKKDKFLERCYEIGRPFALLLPLTALEGIARGKMYRKYGISLIVMDRRIDFTGKGNNWFGVGWFHWGFYNSNLIEFWKV